jgi:hypothetical protein
MYFVAARQDELTDLRGLASALVAQSAEKKGCTRRMQPFFM